ncbi:hypothetical protein TRFO_28119 [Tritrichomonas foetus]|uniref:Ankyrin repeat protein n=1 Tax=Tritrichomonas foetus TaxID=1144522 RepID=A0A1J4K0Q5_9EUKA|nr:hypothetical protein TRFO_28119 [Tritrichomonas foetus]|eukprot:OHT04360.1 hypothetical protein TRFO_28119 [Tritrichomonas foetus]
MDIQKLIDKIKGDKPKYLENHFSKEEITSFTFQKKIFSIDSVLQDNPPILSVAAFYGAQKCLKFLIENGASLAKLDNFKRSVQYFAVAGGYIPIIEILSSYKLEFSDYTHLAAGLGNLAILKYLIHELKCDPTSTDALGNTLLHNVAIGGDSKTAKYLLDNEFIDVNCRDYNIFFISLMEYHIYVYNTPLHLAVYHGNLNVSKLLLKTPGIDLNPTNVFNFY